MWQEITVYIIVAWAIGTVLYKLVRWGKAFTDDGSACNSCSSNCGSKSASNEPKLISIELPDKK